jgi:hypothetical protein
MVGGWVWWDRLTQRRYNDAVAQIRAAGFPVTPDDPLPPSIDPKENAAPVLVDAARKIQAVDGIDAPRVYSDSPALEADMMWLRQFTRLNAEVIAEVHRAQSLPKVQLDDVKLSEQPRYEQFQRLRRLYDLMEAAYAYAHHSGNDDVAVECLRAMVLIGRAEQSSSDEFVRSGGTTFMRMTAETAQTFGHDLLIYTDRPRPSYRQIWALADELADAKGMAARRDQVFCDWRAKMRSDIQWSQRHPFPPSGLPTDAGALLSSIISNLAAPYRRAEVTSAYRMSLQMQKAYASGTSVRPVMNPWQPTPLYVFGADEAMASSPVLTVNFVRGNIGTFLRNESTCITAAADLREAAIESLLRR